MEPIRYFEAATYVEPHCRKCNNRIVYDVTTEWDDDIEGQKCKLCGTEI